MWGPVRGLLELVFQRLTQFGINTVPLIGQALVILAVGWLLGAVLRKLFRYGLRAAGLDVVFSRISDQQVVRPSQVGGQIVYGLVLLTALLLALDVLGLEAATALLNDLLLYIPKLLVAVIMLGLGWYLVEFIGQLLVSIDLFNSPERKHISSIGRTGVKVFLWSLVILAAAEQLDVATVFLTVAFVTVLAACALAVVIVCGLGGKDSFNDVLAGYAIKTHISPGEVIFWCGQEATVLTIGLTATKLRLGETSVLVANAVLLDNRRS